MVVEEPPLGGRVACPRRLRGPPRPRPLEHAPDDRGRRHADRDRADAGTRCRGSSAGRSRATVSPRRRSGSPPAGSPSSTSRWSANGIAMGRLVEHGWSYQTAKQHMGKWYKVPIGVGAGVMGARLLVLRGERRPDRLPVAARARPEAERSPLEVLRHRSAALTVGTVQGVIQVQPANADWLYRGRPRGRVDRPDQPRAHQPRHRADDARRRRAVLPRAAARRHGAVSTRSRTAASSRLLGGSLAFYGSALYLGFHEGRLVVDRGLTPEQAEEATPLHPFLIMVAGHRDARRRSGSCSLARARVRAGARAARSGLRARRLRGARRRHAAGTGAGVAGRQRAARPRAATRAT